MADLFHSRPGVQPRDCMQLHLHAAGATAAYISSCLGFRHSKPYYIGVTAAQTDTLQRYRGTAGGTIKGGAVCCCEGGLAGKKGVVPG